MTSSDARPTPTARPLPWLERLQPPHGNRHEPATGEDLLGHARRRLGDGPVAWVVEVGSGMAELIISEMPEFGGTPEAVDILRMGTESSTLRFLLNLVDGKEDPIATDEALDGVRDFVRRGIGMESVLRGIRLGHRGMSESFLSACETLGDPAERLDDMKALTTQLFRFMDDFAARMASQYLDEQMRWSAGDSAARLELVNAILDGQNPDPTAAQRTLRYDLRETHIALSAWTREHRDVDAVALQNLCLSLLSKIKASFRLVIPVGAGRVWAWGTIGVSPDVAEQTIAETVLPHGVGLSTGTPAPGIDGFRSSHQEAEAVWRLLPPADEREVLPYRSVDLLSLMLEDQERALTFAARELGALSSDSPSHRDLRETVAVFLDERGSTHAASERLNVARNTVSYRVRRAETILQRSINERSAQLRAALLLAAALPQEVDATAARIRAAGNRWERSS